jgi:hypothetical protein
MAIPKKINAGTVTHVAKKQRQGGHCAAFHARLLCLNNWAYLQQLSVLVQMNKAALITGQLARQHVT